MTSHDEPPTSNVRCWMALIGSTVLGFGIGDMIYVGGADGTASKGFITLGIVAGFGLGLVLAAFLWRSQPKVHQTVEWPPSSAPSQAEPSRWRSPPVE